MLLVKVYHFKRSTEGIKSRYTNIQCRPKLLSQHIPFYKVKKLLNQSISSFVIHLCTVITYTCFHYSWWCVLHSIYCNGLDGNINTDTLPVTSTKQQHVISYMISVLQHDKSIYTATFAENL